MSDHLTVDKNWNITPSSSIKKKPKLNKNPSLLMMETGMYLATPLLLGVALGVFLDSYFKTKPILTIICIGFGTINTFYNLWKLSKTDGTQ